MKITEQATSFLKNLLDNEPLKTLRFYAIPGCCGVSVGAEIDVPQEEDSKVLLNGITIAVDPIALPELEQVTIDVQEQNGEVGLVLNGYNQTSC